MTYQLTTISSGLRIASESLPTMETVAIAVTVDVGARHETPDQHGVSHLLEHMAFKGTERRNALEIAESFDRIGGHLNAYTSHEHTVYYAKVLKEDAPLAIDILADIVQHSVFDAAELEREKQVILQELAMHHDTPDDLVFDQFQETAFPGQALGRSILGTAGKIQSHTSDGIKRFVARHYHPTRMVVSAAGNIEHDQLVDLVARQFERGQQPPSAASETGRYVGGDSVKGKKLEQLQLVIGMEGLPRNDPRYHALQVLSIVLGGGMSSRLFQEVREKRGLVYTIQSLTASYADTGVFAVYAATGEQEVRELIPVVCDQLRAVCSHIGEDELLRAKNQQKANYLMARESTSSLAEWIGRHLVQYGEYRDAANLRARIDGVTIEQVKELAGQLFINPKLTLAALGPTGRVGSSKDIIQKLAA
jgi:predicted Zn-dependent peptidase